MTWGINHLKLVFIYTTFLCTFVMFVMLCSSLFVIVRHRSSPFVIIRHRSSSFISCTSSVHHMYVICTSSVHHQVIFKAIKTTFAGFIDILRHNVIWTSFYDTSTVSDRCHHINKGKFALSIGVRHFCQIHVYLT